MVDVFVYGSLMPGQSAYSLCEAGVLAAHPAIAHGQLYQLPFNYPAFVPSTLGTVQGVVLSFNNANVLAQLDTYEQHDPEEFKRYFPQETLVENQYTRIQISLAKKSAWSYTMTLEQIHRLNGVPIPSGRWQDAGAWAL
jgi:gamma-glutamylcyclotransferase (GGCT)/AIG2-like uncharacterized protein YtfP